jgi:hypothetical protein
VAQQLQQQLKGCFGVLGAFEIVVMAIEVHSFVTAIANVREAETKPEAFLQTTKALEG